MNHSACLNYNMCRSVFCCPSRDNKAIHNLITSVHHEAQSYLYLFINLFILMFSFLLRTVHNNITHLWRQSANGGRKPCCAWGKPETIHNVLKKLKKYCCLIQRCTQVEKTTQYWNIHETSQAWQDLANPRLGANSRPHGPRLSRIK